MSSTGVFFAIQKFQSWAFCKVGQLGNRHGSTSVIILCFECGLQREQDGCWKFNMDLSQDSFASKDLSLQDACNDLNVHANNIAQEFYPLLYLFVESMKNVCSCEVRFSVNQ